MQAVIDDITKGKIQILDGNVSLNPDTVSDYLGTWKTAIKMKDDIFIEGMGDSTILKFVDNNPDDVMMFEVFQKTNVKLKHLKLDINCRNAVDDDCNVAVFFRGNSGLYNLTIDKCHLYDCFYGLYGDGGGLGKYDVIITDNLFTRPAGGGMRGISLHNIGDNSIISRNRLGDYTNGMSKGIDVDSIVNVIVGDNIIYVAPAGYGIFLYDAANDSIYHDNKIIGVSGTTIGFYIHTTVGKECHRNKLRSNEFKDLTTGISIPANCEDNKCFGNGFNNVTTPLSDAGLRTKTPEIFYPAVEPSGETYSNYRVWTLAGNSGEQANISGYVPSPFHQLLGGYLVFIPEGTPIGYAISIDYAKNGEAHNTHTQAIGATGHAVTADQITEKDLVAALTNLSENDYMGVNVIDRSQAGDNDFHILGLRLRYV